MKLHGLTASAISAGLVFGLIQASQSELIRFCAENKDEVAECRRFRTIPPLNGKCDSDATNCVQLECTESKDCLDSVLSGSADVMMVSPIALYYMDKANPEVLQPVVKEQRGADIKFSLDEDPSNTGLGYNVLAIVKTETCGQDASFNLASTQDFASCHGDYGSMAGWVTPVIQLEESGLSSGNSDAEIIQSFYQSSCAPANNGTRLCTACSPPEANDQCALDNDFAGAVGTLRCVREGTAQAPRVGFVDHLTALGAGQNGTFEPQAGKLSSFKDSAATQQNEEDFRAICRTGGCRGLRNAAQDADCYLEAIPADAAIMRADNPSLKLVQQQLIAASQRPGFQNLFGTNGNLRGALFSHGTHALVAEDNPPKAYIGDGLMQSMIQYDALFSITPQTDATQAPPENVVVVSQDAKDNDDDKTNVGAAVGATLAVALLFGLLAGCGCLWCVYRRKKKGQYDPQAQDPYMQKASDFDDGAQTSSTVPQAGAVLMDEA